MRRPPDLLAVLLAAGLAFACERAGTMGTSRPGGGGSPVIFIGLDGADWQLLDGYLSAGAMPVLAALVAEGRGGVLETEQPPLSPLLWTTMMTGVSPLEHRILDFTRHHPETGAREPITSDERRVPAIWNMVSDAGGEVAVLGLWATYPAEPVSGLMVSDRLFAFERIEEPPPDAVHPPAQAAWALNAVADIEQEIDLAALREFLPWLSAEEYRQRLAGPDPFSDAVAGLRRLLVETRVMHRLATEWIARERPRLAIVYFQGTDVVGHLFAPYAPPRQAAISAEDYERFHSLPETYFREIDTLLGEYKALAEVQRATLLVASDHGFTWGEGRPTLPTGFGGGLAGRWHREEGIYLLWGPGVAAAPGHGERGRIRQVCATLLALLDLPPGQGLAGPPLPGAPSSTGGPFDYSARWQPPSATAGPTESGEALAKLRALGYLSSSEAPARLDDAGGTRTGASHNNEALILESADRIDEAAAAYERALALESTLASANWNLSQLLFRLGRDLERSDELLVEALAGGLADGAERVLGRVNGYRETGREQQAARLVQDALGARPDDAQLRLFRGRDLLAAERCAEAAADFGRAVELTPDDPLAPASLGLALLCLGDETAARRALLRSLELDPNQPELSRFLEGGAF